MTKVNFSKKKYQKEKGPYYIYDSRDNDPAIKKCNNQDKTQYKHNTEHTYNIVHTTITCNRKVKAET
jgi:hypothetical protein